MAYSVNYYVNDVLKGTLSTTTPVAAEPIEPWFGVGTTENVAKTMYIYSNWLFWQHR